VTATAADLDTIRAVYAALGAQDVAAITALTDPDVQIYQSEELPYGGVHHGYDGLAEFLGGVAKAIDSRLTTGDLYIAGDDIVQIGRSTGVARSTGTPFDSPEVHIWRVRDGRITNLRSYIDTVEVTAALRG